MLAASSTRSISARLSGSARVVVEQAAVEPVDVLEAEATARLHGAEQRPAERLELGRVAPRLLEHAREHRVRQEPDVFGEHAEHQAVDEVRHGLRVVALGAQVLGQPGELLRRDLGDVPAGQARAKLLGLGERPFELLAVGAARAGRRGRTRGAPRPRWSSW